MEMAVGDEQDKNNIDGSLCMGQATQTKYTGKVRMITTSIEFYWT